MAQLIDLIVNRRVFFNVGIRGRNIRLGLIIVIVGDEILYGVVREKFLKLAVELCRQSLVMSNNQRRFIQLLDDIRHRESLSGTSDAQKGLALVAFFETIDQLLNGLGLVAGRFIF